MELIWLPQIPWFELTLIIIVAIVIMYAFALLRGNLKRMDGNAVRKFLVVMFSVLAIILLTLAVRNPAQVRDPEAGVLHLAVVIDVSDSVMRDKDWSQVQSIIFETVRAGLSTLPDEVLDQSTGSVILMRGAAFGRETVPLRELAQDILQITASDFPSATGTSLNSGLRLALRHINQAGGRGEVLLVSDGHDTTGNDLDAVDELSQQGIPVIVLPASSRVPALSITSANLPPQVVANQVTTMRMVLYNTNPNPIAAAFSIWQNPGLPPDNTGLFGVTLAQEDLPVSLQGGQYGRLRPELRFEGVGLQFVDVQLADTESDQQHYRRFFTHVDRPLRFLAIGGNFEWVSAMSPEVAEVEQVQASSITASTDFVAYDAVVISEVPATSFQSETLDALATAVTDDAIGLMIINGDHGGADEKTPTILRTYHETVIDPLLPVTTEPQPLEEPPTRNLVFVIDQSGSMCGWPIEMARNIATHLVNEYMRESDYVTLVSFTAGAEMLLEQEQMTASGKQYALDRIASITCGGGTYPEEALRIVRQMFLPECGMVFLSDGIFDVSAIASNRPDCRTAVFDIGHPDPPPDSPLYELADPYGVGENFDPTNVTIPYFEPEMRDKFFENGNYTPLSLQGVGHFNAQGYVPIPAIGLQGTAITYMRDDGDRMALRPRFIDPVLAYRQAEQGITGVFTTGFQPEWLTSEDGRIAIEEWMRRLVAYEARDRYLFTITDEGSELGLQIQVQQGGVPRLNGLIVQLEVMEADGETSIIPVTMRELEEEPATFAGRIPLQVSDVTRQGVIVIEEEGPDALARPQRVPMLIPLLHELDDATNSEASKYGLNETVLQQIADATGGIYPLEDGHSFFSQLAQPTPLVEYWRHLALLGALMYLLAIVVKRL